MCVSMYDLVCDKCRAKHDEIFGRLTAKGDYTLEEETAARERWFRSLCEDCKKQMREEGFLPPESYATVEEAVEHFRKDAKRLREYTVALYTWTQPGEQQFLDETSVDAYNRKEALETALAIFVEAHRDLDREFIKTNMRVENVGEISDKDLADMEV